MHFTSSILALVPFLSLSLAAPTEKAEAAPLLPDGLPNPTPEQLQKIERAAHGTLPGLPLPTNISAVGITNLQLLAFQEFVEVSFFHEVIENITHSAEGFKFVDPVEREFALRSLNSMLAVGCPDPVTESAC